VGAFRADRKIWAAGVGMGIELRLLGDVEVRVDGRLVELGHARQRCVLVVLVVEANRVVSVDALVERVWGDRAPQRARETLYSYLSRLRQALGSITEIDLVRQPGGYALTVNPMAVDVHRFHYLVAQARAADDQDRALVLFEQALGLWRGEPFAGLDAAWVSALRSPLERDRFAVELDCTDLYLRRGQHGWLLSELFTRAAAHPVDERVAGQLMLALYQCGRQAEALEHFQQLRIRLAEELGIDPSPDLQRRYEQILTTDPTLTAPPTTPSALVSVPPRVPRQLPARTPHFVGRTAELDQLTAVLDASTAGGGTVVITAIEGTAGIGKTALALHWAHQVAERFGDGQLYVNLRGFDPTNTPVDPADALRGFLEALGISPERIPTSVQAQAGLYRGLLADRRVLVVLDNARDADQVRPLLPASPSCLVVITSRNQLAGLIAEHGARPLTLDVLSPPEARALLARHLGPERISADAAAITELIHHCVGLPLALAIVAARAATHPGFALRVLAKELTEEHTRLDALDTGDPATSARAVFSWSYQHLSPPTGRMFRLLGLHPGPDIALAAAAHLTETPPHQAREALSELTRAHLLTQHTPGRYTFHDLLRAYASHLTSTQDSPDDQRTALTRLFDHYLHTAAATMNILHPAAHHHLRRLSFSAIPTLTVADPATAQRWLNIERANLAAIITYTAAQGWPTYTTHLANTVLHGYFGVLHYPHALALYTHVQRAARHINDHTTEALALNGLGAVHGQQGRYQQATDHLQHALTICRETGDRISKATALHGLGLICWGQGRYQQATDHYQQVLAICREIGERSGEAITLAHLGLVQGQQGHYQQATEHLQHALTLCRETGNRIGEAIALHGLGVVHGQQGRYPQATDHLQQALTISRETGYRYSEAITLARLGRLHGQQGRYQQATDHLQHALTLCRETGYRALEALALTHLGRLHGQQGRHQQASDHLQQALMICREIGYRAIEARILNGLGETYQLNGQLAQAHSQHTAALTVATETGDRYEQAHAHHGLARTHHTTGHPDQAHHHRQQAHALYSDLGIPTPTTSSPT
jgi:DNA-binding SARP family transcriptional activator/Flp pilus assembly protein TadD